MKLDTGGLQLVHVALFDLELLRDELRVGGAVALSMQSTDWPLSACVFWNSESSVALWKALLGHQTRLRWAEHPAMPLPRPIPRMLPIASVLLMTFARWPIDRPD